MSENDDHGQCSGKLYKKIYIFPRSIISNKRKQYKYEYLWTNWHKYVSNQILNLVVITLELNNAKKKKKSEVGMFESAPTFDYLRNIIDHFSSKVASTEVVQS